MTVTTIDQVVRAAIAENGYKNLRKYLMYLLFAFDCLYKLKRDNVIVSFRYIAIPVVDRRAVIPPTVIAMGQIGWQRGVHIHPSVSGPMLSLDPTATPSEFAGYGIYSGMKYRVDRSVVPAEIVFDTQPAGGVIYVEVIDQTDSYTTETLVGIEGVLPMKSYIAFRQARFKMGAASGEAQAAEREFLDELDEAQASLSDLTPGGIWFALSQKEVRSRLGMEYPFFFGAS